MHFHFRILRFMRQAGALWYFQNSVRSSQRIDTLCGQWSAVGCSEYCLFAGTGAARCRLMKPWYSLASYKTLIIVGFSFSRLSALSCLLPLCTSQCKKYSFNEYLLESIIGTCHLTYAEQLQKCFAKDVDYGKLSRKNVLSTWHGQEACTWNSFFIIFVFDSFFVELKKLSARRWTESRPTMFPHPRGNNCMLYVVALPLLNENCKWLRRASAF